MQCAAIEFARNVLGIKRANSTEFDKEITGDEQVGRFIYSYILGDPLSSP